MIQQEIQAAFGPGTFWACRTDVQGATPVKLIAFQEATIEHSYNTKSLIGSRQIALAIGRGELKITVKFKQAVIQGKAMFDLFFGQAATVGQIKAIEDELGTIPSESPYTLVAANAETFLENLGVIGALSGRPMTLVDSAPATGEYAVDPETGTYTFAAADAGLAVAKSYTHQAADGYSVALSNELLGKTPYFKGWLKAEHDDSQALCIFKRLVSDKLSYGTKLEDWMTPEFNAQACDDGSGVPYILNTAA